MIGALDLKEYAKSFRAFLRRHSDGKPPNMVQLTEDYEGWCGAELAKRKLSVHRKDLAVKHRNMSLSAFLFLRGTFYAWIARFFQCCPELVDAPVVLAVGDLHLENFGSWRDLFEAWLNWGCNDVDEAFPLPYTNDLVRLAVSTKLAIKESHLSLRPGEAYDAILAGYTAMMELGGRAFILAEQNPQLRVMAVNKLKVPELYWAKLEAELTPVIVPVEVLAILEKHVVGLEQSMPDSGLKYKFGHRTAGEGSLGRPRIVCMTSYHGTHFAREAKALLPSACVWAGIGPQGADKNRIFYDLILECAVRVRDPFVGTDGNWIVRRLSPDCSRINLPDLPKQRDEHLLLHSMGAEIANVHLGTPGAREAILKDLKRQGSSWLSKAAKVMAKQTTLDQCAWAEHYNSARIR